MTDPTPTPATGGIVTPDSPSNPWIGPVDIPRLVVPAPEPAPAVDEPADGTTHEPPSITIVREVRQALRAVTGETPPLRDLAGVIRRRLVPATRLDEAWRILRDIGDSMSPTGERPIEAYGSLAEDVADLVQRCDDAHEDRDAAREQVRVLTAERDDLRIDQAGKKDHIRVLAERLIDLEAAIVKTRRERDGARQCNDNQAAALRRVQDLANRYDAVCAGGPLKSYRAAEIRAALAGPATPPAQPAQDGPADTGGATGQGEAAEAITGAAEGFDWRQWLATDIYDTWPTTPASDTELDAAQDALDNARDEIDPPHTPERWQAAVAAADRLMAEVRRLRARPAPGLAARAARELVDALRHGSTFHSSHLIDVLTNMLTELDGEWALRQRSDRGRHELAQELAEARQALTELKPAPAPIHVTLDADTAQITVDAGADDDLAARILAALTRLITTLAPVPVPGSDATRETPAVCAPCRRGDHDSCDWDEQAPLDRCTCRCPEHAAAMPAPAGLDVDEIMRQVRKHAAAHHLTIASHGSSAQREYAAKSDAALDEIRRLLEAGTPQPPAEPEQRGDGCPACGKLHFPWCEPFGGDGYAAPELAPQPVPQPRVWHAGEQIPDDVTVSGGGIIWDRERDSKDWWFHLRTRGDGTMDTARRRTNELFNMYGELHEVPDAR